MIIELAIIEVNPLPQNPKSSICFNLDQSKILSSSNGLTLVQSNNILDRTNLKVFVDNSIAPGNTSQMINFLLERVENSVGKCWFPAFSAFFNIF